jgi:acyl-CoA synthetase (AMP-forming)/AMP-acid ligase II
MIAATVHRFDPARILWITEDTQVTAGDLSVFLHRYDTKPLAARNVALWVSKPLAFAFAIVATEGCAARVLLLPSDAASPVIRHLLMSFGADIILTDHAVPADLQDLGIPVITLPTTMASISLSSTSWPEASLLTRWVIPTSGTTGPPKLVAHTIRSLTRTSKTDPDTGSRYRWGLLYDPARFAGLQVFLNSLLSASSLIMADPSWSLERRLSLFVDKECNALSATPTMWRKLLMTPYVEQLRLRQITLGGEIADQGIINALRRSFPDTRIAHIYASTEVGVGFSVTDDLAGFPKSMLDHPPSGVDLRVSPDGFLLIRPHIQDQTYLGNHANLLDEDGFINTGDLVAEENLRFVFRGRANGSINVGGNKVQPEEVERVLYAFPGVKLVKVYGKRNPMTGYVVAADVVLDSEQRDPHSCKRDLVAHCTAHLTDFKVPALIRIVQDLAVTQSGKLMRQ